MQVFAFRRVAGFGIWIYGTEAGRLTEKPVELSAAVRGGFLRGGWLARKEFLCALRGAQGRESRLHAAVPEPLAGRHGGWAEIWVFNNVPVLLPVIKCSVLKTSLDEKVRFIV